MIDPMRRRAFFGRSVAAIILTGIISPLALAAGAAAFFFLADRPVGSVGGVMAFVGTIWFFGSFVATICAVLLGVLLEWPKAKWLTGLDKAGITRSILVSIAGAEILLLSALTISTALQPPSQFSNEAGEVILFVVIAAAVGGLCSAAFWWILVIMPMRRAKEI